MVTLKIKARIVEPNFDRFKEVKKVLGRLRKAKIVIINIWCINNQNLFLKIKKLINDQNYLKIFHGGNEKVFDNMVISFCLQNRKDIVYVNDELERRKLADCYQKYTFKSFT